MIKSNYCVLDCETGGLDKTKNPITQFAAIILDGRTLKELDRWETFVKPYDGKVIEKQALQHTMVSMSDINAGISKKEFAATAKTWFGEHQAKATRADMGRLIMVGHNVLPFDRPFLDECFAEFGWSCDDYFYPGGIDTLPLAKLAFGIKGDEKINLGACLGYAKLKLTDAHGAMNDVEGNADLLRWFMRKLRAKKGEGSGSESSEERAHGTEFFEFMCGVK